MGLRNRIPVDRNWGRDDRKVRSITIFCSRYARYRDVLRWCGKDVGEDRDTLHLATILQPPFDLVSAFWETPEELVGSQLIEGRLRTLEEQLSQSLRTQSPAAEHIQECALPGPL